MKRLPVVVTALLLLTGCADTQFVYKPSAPAAGARKLPVKVAVLPFHDGTGNFTRRGGFTGGKKSPFAYNLAKAGWGSVISAVPPELWAKGLADEMAASGRFQAANFLFSPSEMTDEAFRIEGTLRSATRCPVEPNEFALDLRALRRSDNLLVWEKEVKRVWKTPGTLVDGCRLGPQCFTDRHRAEVNRVMQEMFAEAGADLAAKLVPMAGRQGGDTLLPEGEAGPAADPPPGSVDGEIDRILKGN